MKAEGDRERQEAETETGERDGDGHAETLMPLYMETLHYYIMSLFTGREWRRRRQGVSHRERMLVLSHYIHYIEETHACRKAKHMHYY